MDRRSRNGYQSTVTGMPEVGSEMIDNPLNRLSAHRGEQCHNAKLSDAKVAKILELVAERNRLRQEASKLSNANLAKRYGVHECTIEKAIAGYTWSHVTGNV